MTTTPAPENRRARARTSDPFTSHAAAAVASRNLPTVRAAVYSILEDADEPMTHDQLIAQYRRWQMNGQARPGATDSSIRSRCNELEKDQLVLSLPDERGRSRYGNPAGLYVARSVYERETERAQGALL
ncbi:hypothetical protein [Brachybacterium sp.]|uniref:hypothetical protein n=1 Tax=Brachybacterium sp. TaxID=1891286 RepID=UPI002ED4F0CF